MKLADLAESAVSFIFGWALIALACHGPTWAAVIGGWVVVLITRSSPR